MSTEMTDKNGYGGVMQAITKQLLSLEAPTLKTNHGDRSMTCIVATRGETIRINAVLHLSVLQYIAILQYLIRFW